MPTYDDHCAYWDRIREWWETGVICEDGSTEVPVGYWYITDRREVGIHICSKSRRKGYGSTVIKWLVRTHGDRPLYANVAPGNAESRRMFESLGWELTQVTYASA